MTVPFLPKTYRASVPIAALGAALAGVVAGTLSAPRPTLAAEASHAPADTKLAAAMADTKAPKAAPAPRLPTKDVGRVLNQLPFDAPDYLRATWQSALQTPLPVPAPAPSRAAGGRATVQALTAPVRLNSFTAWNNPTGALGLWMRNGASVDTTTHPFFRPLGTNGRTCFSCHQPINGMSIGAGELRSMWDASGGTDPVFAPVDAANCPSAVPAGVPPPRAAYSLLLNKGLFRVFLPMPRQTSDLSAVGGLPAHPTEFTLQVLSDPTGCNTDPQFNQVVDPVTQEVRQIVSVYRRPRPSVNLPPMTVPVFTQNLSPNQTIDNVTRAPVRDPVTLQPIGGNLMWDGREPTLESQARAATLGHAQATTPPTPQQVAQIVAFESQAWMSQVISNAAGNLFGGTPAVFGSPDFMAAQTPSFGGFRLYDAWNAPVNPAATAQQRARSAIGRGQVIFATRQFTIANVSGFNNSVRTGTGNPARNTCASCHGNLPTGSDPFAAAHGDIGIGGTAIATNGPPPSTDLPVFRLTCSAPFRTITGATVVDTNDPGLALITGRCVDIGRRSVPQLRGLAGRAPYFSDGSAATVRATVDFYNRRFSIGLTEQEAQDLTAFLSAL